MLCACRVGWGAGIRAPEWCQMEPRQQCGADGMTMAGHWRSKSCLLVSCSTVHLPRRICPPQCIGIKYYVSQVVMRKYTQPNNSPSNYCTYCTSAISLPAAIAINFNMPFQLNSSSLRYVRRSRPGIKEQQRDIKNHSATLYVTANTRAVHLNNCPRTNYRSSKGR
jgi:hypothetical protein